MKIEKSKQVWLEAILLVVAIGLADWLTGYDLSFFLFYFAPIALIAWRAGWIASLALAFCSTLVWFGADWLSGHPYLSPLHTVWNTAVRLIAFLVIAWSVSRMRESLLREKDTASRLKKALSEVRVLEAVLPICAQCKKIRDDTGVWQPLETYIGQHADTQFSHGYCPECARRALREAGLGEDDSDQ